MTYTIPNHLIYRHYGDTTIAINNRRKQVVFLTDQSQQIFRNLLDDKAWDATTLPMLTKLSQLGLLDDNTATADTPRLDNEATLAHNNPAGAISLWSFRNQIPLSGHFELTGRCNLRCLHCYCTFTEKRDALSTEQVFKIIDDLHDAGTLGLVLTGGEIFVRKDIEDILRYLQSRKFIIRINTNATLLKPSTVQLLAELTNIYRIHISLYGAEAAVHDAVTQVKGSFDKTQASILALKQAGQDVRINCSIMQTNANSYQDVQKKIGKPLDIPIRFDPFIFPKDDGSTDNLGELINGGMLAEFDRFNGRQEAALPKKPKLCKASFSFFSIDEYGDVYPCLKMKKYMAHPLGRVPQQRFSDIWQSSQQVLAIRASLEQKLRNCSVCDIDI